RYEAARSLDPKLVAADIFLARLALFELGKTRAMPAISSLASKIGDAPTTRALRALAWVVDPARGDEPPADAKLSSDDAAKLPAPLACVPRCWRRRAPCTPASTRSSLVRSTPRSAPQTAPRSRQGSASSRSRPATKRWPARRRSGRSRS